MYSTLQKQREFKVLYTRHAENTFKYSKYNAKESNIFKIETYEKIKIDNRYYYKIIKSKYRFNTVQ